MSAASGSANRVGFGPRLGAYLIDAILGMVAGGVLGSVFGLGAAGGAVAAGAGDDTAALAGVVAAIAGMAVGVVVINLIEAFAGASLGKMMLGLVIGTADATPGSTGLFFARYAVKNSSSILSLLAMLTASAALQGLSTLAGLVIFIGCFFVLGQAAQALHDKVVGTAVYRKKELLGA